MTDKDQNSDEVTVETTSVFRADFLNELDAPASTGAESAAANVSCAASSAAAMSRTRRRARATRAPSCPT